jgi:hypothetical protein
VKRFVDSVPQLELLRLETWQSTPMQSKPLTLRTLHCLGFVSKSRSTKSDLELFQNFFRTIFLSMAEIAVMRAQNKYDR